VALDTQLMPGAPGPWQAEFVEAGAHDAAAGFEVALDQQPHGDRGGVPTAGGQPAKYRGARVLVEVEWLGIELDGEGLDVSGLDRQPAGTEGLSDGEAFKVALGHSPISRATRARRLSGQGIGPNQAPLATAPAFISPNAASAALSATKTYETSPLHRRASQPPPAAIASRVRFASSGQSSRPAPCDAKYS